MEVFSASKSLCENGHYRMSVYNSCLAVELFLKSRLYLVEGSEDYEFSHDTINIYRHLRTKFPSKIDLTRMITLARKYFNESRYPHGDTGVFTKDFALEFLENVETIKDYIDNECTADIKDLKGRFQR